MSAKRFNMMSREQTLAHLRDRGVEEMRTDDPMYPSIVAEMRLSTRAIESGELDSHAITSKELASRRSPSYSRAAE